MPVGAEQASRDAVTASVEAAFHVLTAKRKRDEESLEEQKLKCAKEVEKVRADAAEAAAKVKKAAIQPTIRQIYRGVAVPRRHE